MVSLEVHAWDLQKHPQKMKYGFVTNVFFNYQYSLMIILFFTCTYYCISIFLLLHIYNPLISFFPTAYRAQTLGVPKSLKDPHITKVLGTPEPHIPSDMGPPVPISLGIWGRGPQIGGSPFHADTGTIHPATLCCTVFRMDELSR